MKIKTASKLLAITLISGSFTANAAIKENDINFSQADQAQQAQHQIQLISQPEFLGNDYYNEIDSSHNKSIQHSILGEGADEVVLHVIDDAQMSNLVEMDDVAKLQNDPRMQQLMDSPEFQNLMQEFK